MNFIRDNGSYFGGQLAIGDVVTRVVTVDDWAPDGLPDEVARGYYLYGHPGYSFTTTAYGAAIPDPGNCFTVFQSEG